MNPFNFRRQAPAAATAPLPSVNLVHVLIRKRSVFPDVASTRGESKTIARQLDVTLMKSGFKLSPSLLGRLGECDFASAIAAAQDILAGVKELIGDHVRHNPYFIRFPHQVPDTLDFWVECILQYYVNDDEIYGQHRHTYEEMLRHHSRLRPKAGAQLKVIDLGGPLESELRELFASLAGATIPLNAEDRGLLATLFERGCTTDTPVRIRENKAILNALRLRKDQTVEVDTVVDVLRLACALSDGDVTLATNTKFKSFSRGTRRKLVEAIDALVARDRRKLDDVSGYKERFKRLAEKIHPREYPEYEHAALLFDFTGGKVAINTFGHRVHEAVKTGRLTHDFRTAVEVLSERPGMLLKHVDLVLRSGNDGSVAGLLDVLRERVGKISGRNLLNLDQHLMNRTATAASRIFVNRLGGGFATNQSLPELSEEKITPFRALIREELSRRIPSCDLLVVDWASLKGLTVPISEKSKSDGFSVLPRGSTFPVARGLDGSLRFFIYWKQREHRTDYDLSCAFYNANFELVTQVSWTNLRNEESENPVIVHSGDFTDAPNGATEFIDIQLRRLDPRITYILPSANFFAGENFATAEEVFFGFMERPSDGRGRPFEAKTVSTKFALRGTGKVCVPMVFVRDRDGAITGKWLDIYSRGLFWANRVEHHKFTTIGLAKAILEKSFTPLEQLVELYQEKAKTTLAASAVLPANPVTYIGLRRPEGLHPGSKIITLESFRTLIPA